MSDADAWLARTAPRGTPRHYALLDLEPGLRRLALALYALRDELLAVADRCQEPAVAQRTLDWWRDELAAAGRGQASHPITRTLQPALRDGRLEPDALHGLVEGAVMDLHRTRWPDDAARQRYLERTGGGPARQLARLAGHRHPRTPAAAARIGQGLRLSALLQDLPRHLRHGRLPLPLDGLARADLTPAALRPGPTPERARTLFRDELARADALLQEGMANLPAEDRLAQRALWVRAELERALLAEIRRDGCHLLERRVALTPLRQWWITGRSLRRLRRRSATIAASAAPGTPP